MAEPLLPLNSTVVWAALAARRRSLASRNLAELFATDPGRVERRTYEVGDLVIDASKHWVDDATQASLDDLAIDRGVAEALAAMWAGERINPTEGRAAAHVALRLPAGERFDVDGVDVSGDVHAALDHAAHLAQRLRSGEWTGASGQRITHVVNLGIGGSHLGPAMVHAALTPFADGPEVRFVSNVDGAALADALIGLEPATTCFIVCSKTFTTSETLANARSARSWIVDALGADAVAAHFVAVSTALDEVASFGIDPANAVGFWDWVGGRFSLWSAVGLSVMVAVGPDRFRELLAGAHVVDEHVRTAPVEHNAAVQLALLRVWYSGHWDAAAHAVVPYAARLSLLSAHLQQLEMESLGKSVRADGRPVEGHHTGQVVFGTPGTDGQHAYFQLLHQGTRFVPMDLIGFGHGGDELAGHHDLLLANLLGQAAALAFGRSADELVAAGVAVDDVPHRTFAGGRPTTTILAPSLTPSVLGQIVALYEHTTYVQAVLWGIDAFDQFGVELGKARATDLLPALASGAPIDTDPSTRALLERLRGWRAQR